MQAIDQLLYLIKEQGIEQTLKTFNIDDIEDNNIKTICRVIKYSNEQLPADLEAYITERDKPAAAG